MSDSNPIWRRFDARILDQISLPLMQSMTGSMTLRLTNQGKLSNALSKEMPAPQEPGIWDAIVQAILYRAVKLLNPNDLHQVPKNSSSHTNEIQACASAYSLAVGKARGRVLGFGNVASQPRQANQIARGIDFCAVR